MIFSAQLRFLFLYRVGHSLMAEETEYPERTFGKRTDKHYRVIKLRR